MRNVLFVVYILVVDETEHRQHALVKNSIHANGVRAQSVETTCLPCS